MNCPVCRFLSFFLFLPVLYRKLYFCIMYMHRKQTENHNLIILMISGLSRRPLRVRKSKHFSLPLSKKVFISCLWGVYKWLSLTICGRCQADTFRCDMLWLFWRFGIAVVHHFMLKLDIKDTMTSCLQRTQICAGVRPYLSASLGTVGCPRVCPWARGQ